MDAKIVPSGNAGKYIPSHRAIGSDQAVRVAAPSCGTAGRGPERAFREPCRRNRRLAVARRVSRAASGETRSIFSASSATWRKVVILPPTMLSSGGSPSRPSRSSTKSRVASWAETIAIVLQRPNPRIAPDHIGWGDRVGEVLVRGIAQIGDLMRRNRDPGEVPGEIDIGGADQRELALVGDGKHDAAVGVLEDIGIVVVEQLRHDDVAAPDQPDTRCRIRFDARGPYRTSRRHWH